ncbi:MULTISPECIES: hypothetical protein [unclassified Polynucleobacter]|nr:MULTISPECIES: hypothetical protein [unclassified Polynucleobacter]
MQLTVRLLVARSRPKKSLGDVRTQYLDHLMVDGANIESDDEEDAS